MVRCSLHVERACTRLPTDAQAGRLLIAIQEVGAQRPLAGRRVLLGNERLPPAPSAQAAVRNAQTRRQGPARLPPAAAIFWVPQRLSASRGGGFASILQRQYLKDRWPASPAAAQARYRTHPRGQRQSRVHTRRARGGSQGHQGGIALRAPAAGSNETDTARAFTPASSQATLFGAVASGSRVEPSTQQRQQQQHNSTRLRDVYLHVYGIFASQRRTADSPDTPGSM